MAQRVLRCTIEEVADWHANLYLEPHAVYRMSAASCYEKAGDLSRAVNLYQAALAGPLRAVTRKEVEGMLASCLTRLKAVPTPRKAGGAGSALGRPDKGTG